MFDSTAIHAAELLSASLHGMLTNASTRWFSLRFRNDERGQIDKENEKKQSASSKLKKSF